MTDHLTRRELLQRAAAGGSVLTLPGLLAACGHPAPRSIEHVATPRRAAARAHRPAAHLAPARAMPTRSQLLTRFGSMRPVIWGLDIPQVQTTLPTHDSVVALTFDACGGPRGSGYNRELIELLRRHSVSATLFMTATKLELALAAPASASRKTLE